MDSENGICPHLFGPWEKEPRQTLNGTLGSERNFAHEKWDLYLPHHFRCLPLQVQDYSRPLETRGHRDLR